MSLVTPEGTNGPDLFFRREPQEGPEHPCRNPPTGKGVAPVGNKRLGFRAQAKKRQQLRDACPAHPQLAGEVSPMQGRILPKPCLQFACHYDWIAARATPSSPGRSL
uniref:Uncharacterized protein n=1 Tax=uncultured prokaryote TaxID=198431 RepID=H5SLD8_9ZZZZ|nr:hypothetical protein HGMM_F46A05C13 [uncultured prokaryote]